MNLIKLFTTFVLLQNMYAIQEYRSQITAADFAARYLNIDDTTHLDNTTQCSLSTLMLRSEDIRVMNGNVDITDQVPVLKYDALHSNYPNRTNAYRIGNDFINDSAYITIASAESILAEYWNPDDNNSSEYLTNAKSILYCDPIELEKQQTGAHFQVTKVVQMPIVPLNIQGMMKHMLNSNIHIGDNFYKQAQNLKAAALYEVKSIGNDGLFECANLTDCIMPQLTTAGHRVLSWCNSLTSVSLPKLTTAGNSLLYCCTALTEVSLPSLQTAGDSVLYNCTALKSVNLTQLTTAGSGLLSHCKALTKVSLPSLTTAGHRVLSHCEALTSVSLPSLTTAGSGLLSWCISLTSVALPQLTTAGEYLLYNCTALKSVDLTQLTTVGYRLLSHCEALTSVSLPSLTTAGNDLLYTCESLTKVSLPSLTTIGERAFKACYNLKHIDIRSLQDVTNITIPHACTIVAHPAAVDTLLVQCPNSTIKVIETNADGQTQEKIIYTPSAFV